ncbi:hypothetical protein [Mitsuaria sp. GD03876]|uniref:hypothetical protein n=1 Tax=Mitsuaria sp. GD03876 TaxID=2975399 RepID=UPI002449247A|nr:hypothetical protein [Mitsuaria sp. GD03876]MDH0864464.1 hypothetical protein [Mitsuaria sp. GD03876]
MTDLASIQRPATAVRAAVVAVCLPFALAACVSETPRRKPEMSAHETAQHDRCVALLRPMLQGQPVRSTTIERGAHGLDYVWVNTDVHDDEDDLERRVAKGTSHGGHCQFDADGQAVHLQAYALDGDAAHPAPQGDYRFVAGARERVASADER